jgi:hypothetical protein
MEIELEKVDEIFGAGTQRVFIRNLREVVKREIGPKLVAKIMEKFDEFVSNFSSIYGKSEEDPTFPGNWRTELENKLLTEIEENVRIDGNNITLRLGDKSFLGYDIDAPRSDEPIIWLVYYLEGLAGEYAFIDEQVFKDKKGEYIDLSRYGRFGRGFLIHKDEFFSEGWNEYVSFEEARFPSTVPDDFFSTAAAAFVEEANQILEVATVRAFVAALQRKQL